MKDWSSNPKRLQYSNQRAKLIGDVAAGDVEDAPIETDGKNPNAVAPDKLGGLKGGKARAEKLLPERRSEIARKAVKARYAGRRRATDET